MTVTVFSWDAGLDVTRSRWEGLIRQRSLNPSLHPDWLHFSLTAWDLSSQACIAVVERPRTYFAVIPFVIRRQLLYGFSWTFLDLCSNVLSYHADIPSEGPLEDALADFLSSKAIPQWDAFRASNLVSGGELSAALRRLGASSAWGMSTALGECSPYLPLSGTWPEFLRSRSKKLRSNVSRVRRIVQSYPDTSMVWFDRNADTTFLLDAMVSIDAASWKAAAGIAIQRDTAQYRYYVALLPWLAKHGLHANVLYSRKEPIAYVLCANWHGWMGHLKTSFSSTFPDAGAYVIHQSLEKAFEWGVREYDFLGDIAPHKVRWTPFVRQHEDVWLFSTSARARLRYLCKRTVDVLKGRASWRRTGSSNQNKQGRIVYDTGR